MRVSTLPLIGLAIPITATLQPIPRTSIEIGTALSPTSALPLLSPTTTLSPPSNTLSIQNPEITEGPELDLVSVSGVALQEKWHLTTYTTCITLGSYIGCGVHEPVLPGGDEVAGVEGRRVRAWMVGGVAIGVGLLLR